MKNKLFLLVLLVTICIYNSIAQSLAINTDGSTANASALLDVKSTAKGILIPRMSRAERDAITLPATGLLIFQDAPDSIGFYYYNVSSWVWLYDALNSDTTVWKPTGNNSLKAARFLGTLNDSALNFRVNNQNSGIIDSINLNTSFGYGTLRNLTFTGALNGKTNSAFGYRAMDSTTSGQGNTALGLNAMSSNTGGSWNTAIGSYALRCNINANENTAIGHNALTTNTSGTDNVANGFYSQLSNLSGNQNTAIGAYSAKNNATGSGNTSLGYNTNVSNTGGSYNIAVGWEAMYNSSTSSYNVGIGYRALYNNGASGNTAVGYRALFDNGSGSNNTALGNGTLAGSNGGAWNTAVGAQASSNVTTGKHNVSVGYTAGLLYTYGDGNTSVGSQTYTGFNAENYMALGWGAGGWWSSANNVVEIGSGSVTKIGGAVGWSIGSDKRIKTNIKEDVPGLAFINLLRPVTYNLDIHKQMQLTAAGKKENYKLLDGIYDIEKIRMSGFLAQDVEIAAKSIGYDFSGIDVPKNDQSLYGLKYADFVVPMVKAIQEQQQIINKQQQQINKQQLVIDELLKKFEKPEQE